MSVALRPHDAGYPAALLELEQPPDPLFVRGPLDLDAPRVAIVGTRRPSERGLELAHTLARGLAAAGVTVVSGGALGIDGAAHRGALEGGGRTWVVLPTPLDRPGPRTHRRLFDAVLEHGGAWLSEREEDIDKRAFFERNRIVAALVQGLIAVEAKEISGTRHSVEAARALGRWVGAYPWPVGERYGAGCLAWLKGGARLVTGPEDVLPWLGVDASPAGGGRAGPAAGPMDPLSVALRGAPSTAEQLAERLERPLASVLVELTRRELRGQIRALPGGRFQDVAVDRR